MQPIRDIVIISGIHPAKAILTSTYKCKYSELITSHAYFVPTYSNCKEDGFPEQQMLQVHRRPSSAGGPSIAASEVNEAYKLSRLCVKFLSAAVC